MRFSLSLRLIFQTELKELKKDIDLESLFCQISENIKRIDLFKNLINLIKDIRPIKKKAFKYTIKKTDFASKIFFAIKNADIITQISHL